MPARKIKQPEQRAKAQVNLFIFLLTLKKPSSYPGERVPQGYNFASHFPRTTLNTPRKILVTSALPYASGELHLGNMLEHVFTDVWVRFQRLRHHEVVYVCAVDAHGTPTMLRAEAEGVAPEALIDGLREAHVRDLNGFLISHDNYYTTHSDENKAYVERIYGRLEKAGLISTGEVEQLFDEQKGLFLADRYVKGTCPRCGLADQYGDNCEGCGASYEATELIDPVSTLSGETPVKRSSTHYFFDLPQFSDELKAWTGGDAVSGEVANKLAEWLDGGLKPWDISRDGPYFGFVIPGTRDKYFYVWMDAPVGYMASLMNYANGAGKNTGIDFDTFWSEDSAAEVVHFVGKDIIYFHALFWPAVLSGAGYRKPSRVVAHGFLTVNGVKMSKSRGTFLLAQTYLAHLDPEYLRYYFASKLSPSIADTDLNMEDFVNRVNSDLVGKLVNIASRCARFIERNFDFCLAPEMHDPELWADFQERRESIAEYYESCEVGKAVREVMALADRANQYITQHEPWNLIKKEGSEAQVHAICSQGLNMFRFLMICLKPVLPKMAERAEVFLNAGESGWEDTSEYLVEQRIQGFDPLMRRIEQKAVARMMEASKPPEEAETPKEDPGGKKSASNQVSIDEFLRIDLRVAKVLVAESVEGADKLLRLKLDTGDGERQVLAGIRSAYAPEELVGRLVVVVANLAPREMRFGISQGMVLAAGEGGEEIFLLSPDSGAKPGMRVR